MIPGPGQRIPPRAGTSDPLAEAFESMLRIAAHLESSLARRPIYDFLERSGPKDVLVVVVEEPLDLAREALGRQGEALSGTSGVATAADGPTGSVLWASKPSELEELQDRGPILVVGPQSLAGGDRWSIVADAVVELGRPAVRGALTVIPLAELTVDSVDAIPERVWAASKRLASAARLSRALTMLRERVDAVFGELTVEVGLAKTVRPLTSGIDRRSGSREFARVHADIVDGNRELLLPTAALASTIRDRLESLSVNDLSQSPTPLSIRLGIDPALCAELESTVWRHLRPRLEDDLELLAAAGLPRSISPDTLAERMRRASAYSPLYRGDLPKRGFFRRLIEGRQPAYLLMMIASIFGGAFGVSTRTAPLAIAMLLLFIIGFVSTYINWRRQDAELIERELEKLRQMLLQHSREFAQSLTDEKLREIRGLIEEAEDPARAEAARPTGAGASAMGNAREPEVRLRELADCPKVLDRAAALLEDCLRTAISELVAVDSIPDRRAGQPRTP
jgi:hypothetical protein